MAIRFGSLKVGAAVRDILLAIPAVQTTFATVRYGTVVPQRPGSPPAYPALLHYMMSGTYDGAISGPPNTEAMRYAVRFIADAGESVEPVLAAADAAWDAFANIQRIDLGVGSEIVVDIADEWPQPEEVYGADLYPQVGFVLALTLIQGG